MSDQVITTLIIAFFASLPPTIAAFAALMVSRTTDHKSDILLDKTTEIHTMANGNLTRVTAELQVALSKIEGLEKMVATLTAAKAVADTVAEHLAEQKNAANS